VSATDFPHSTADVAAKIGCAPVTVLRRAKPLGVGIVIGGTAGMRFSDADIEQLVAAMRPTAPTAAPRRRRRTRGVPA
jgi:hypothetical protein